jgi:hypothetical protein
MSEKCRVSFQNKFEKLVHLVGFTISICHDARSRERKIRVIKIFTAVIICDLFKDALTFSD